MYILHYLDVYSVEHYAYTIPSGREVELDVILTISFFSQLAHVPGVKFLHIEI